MPLPSSPALHRSHLLILGLGYHLGEKISRNSTWHVTASQSGNDLALKVAGDYNRARQSGAMSRVARFRTVCWSAAAPRDPWPLIH